MRHLAVPGMFVVSFLIPISAASAFQLTSNRTGDQAVLWRFLDPWQDTGSRKRLALRQRAAAAVLAVAMTPAAAGRVVRASSHRRGRRARVRESSAHDVQDEEVLLAGWFEPWSRWSACHRCKQRRRRRCTQKRTCRHRRLVHSRPCGAAAVCQRRLTRAQRPAAASHFSWHFFSAWGQWSSCSAGCTTKRTRRCRYGRYCGSASVRETARCSAPALSCSAAQKRRSGRRRRRRRQRRLDRTAAAPETSTGRAETPQPTAMQSLKSDGVGSVAQCGIGGVSVGRQHRVRRVVGGQRSARGSWPWQAVIFNKFMEPICGGTLVHRRWVLTAAHCLRQKLYVRLGEHKLTQPEFSEVGFKITSDVMFAHPAYNSETVDSDVALLRLPYPGHGSSVACPPMRPHPSPGTQCTVVGWGKSRAGDLFGSDVLRQAEVPLVRDSRCRSVYKEYLITENMFCAGFRKGRVDACAGDSGGPLMCHLNNRWHVQGVTSFGEGCGTRGKYGIYVKLANYRKWLRKTVRRHTNQKRPRR